MVENNKLDRDYFDMAMDDFGVYMLNINSKCDIPEDKAVTDKYYNNFKRLENRRFAKLVSWLYKNYTYKTFPTIANFQDAFEKTSEAPAGNYIPPDPGEKPINKKLYIETFQTIERDMDLMKKLENKVYYDATGKRVDAETSRAKTLIHWIPFIEDKFKNNMAYHIKDKTWEPYKVGMKRLDYFIVRCYYPPNHTFIKEPGEDKIPEMLESK